jgi:hypothetical protein
MTSGETLLTTLLTRKNISLIIPSDSMRSDPVQQDLKEFGIVRSDYIEQKYQFEWNKELI